MAFINLSALLADAAPTQPAATGQPAPSLVDLLTHSLIVPMMIVFGCFIYVSNRSQKKKIREHEERIKALKPGDKVVTNSGIIASIVTVKEKSISIRSADSKMEITKNAIAEVLERAGESSES
jgi:preprotein translocase subunit YajC